MIGAALDERRHLLVRVLSPSDDQDAGHLGVDKLDELGAAMTALLQRRRRSRLTRLRVRVKAAVLRRL
jgi:hypothetical protein